MPRQIQLSEKTLKKIAECLFLAYTAEQAAYIGGISERTLARIRKTPVWLEIQAKALAFEKPYRQKVWQGLPGWQGAAWMLERKYPSLLARPEIQLQVNTASVTNNTIVITAEQAKSMQARTNAIEAELTKLVPPSTRRASAAGDGLESGDASAASSSAGDASREEAPHHCPTRTPASTGSTPDPALSGKFQKSKVSSGSNGTLPASGKSKKGQKARKEADKSGGAAASAGVGKHER
jgi:hypothetical protein